MEKKLVKCLVCGEIFDASLEKCPVCGVGKENFAPVDTEEKIFRKDTQNRYMILGNGAAGMSAAKAIRERDKTGTICIISNEEVPAYNRPMLTKGLAEGLDAEKIAMEDASWYEENRVYQILGKQITGIDAEAKEVLTADGARFRYSRLIYALGSECFIPPIPGWDQPQVVAIRRLSDARKVTELLKETREAVVIGGGVLGLEAAWGIRKSGCKVTVLELGPRLMGRQLDAEAGELLKEISREEGVEIRTGVQIEAIEGEGRVTGVRLGGGEVLPAQLVIISCGVRANTAVAKTAGLETDRAVVVGCRMDTADENIFACGDCAQYEGINYAIWPQAVEQGKVAGANAAGQALTYTTVPAALTFHGMNTALFSVGDNGTNPELAYTSKEIRDEAARKYEKYYFCENRLCGVILIGDVSRMAELTGAVERKAAYEELFG